MLLESILTIVGIALYTLASLFALLCLVRTPPLQKNLIPALLTMGAIPFVVILGMHAGRSGLPPVFGRFEAACFYVLITSAAYLRIARQRRMQGVAAILIPCLTCILLWGIAASSGRISPNVPLSHHTIWLGLHACAAFSAYALFSLAGLLAVIYLVQDRNLKQKRLGILFDRLPALESLDRLMSLHVGFAFLMLTVSMGIGLVLVRHSGSMQVWITDPKVAATLVTWTFYAVLVHMRASAGRHGKGVAIVTAVGCCWVLFVFVGIYADASGVHGAPPSTLNQLP